MTRPIGPFAAPAFSAATAETVETERIVETLKARLAKQARAAVTFAADPSMLVDPVCIDTVDRCGLMDSQTAIIAGVPFTFSAFATSPLPKNKAEREHKLEAWISAAFARADAAEALSSDVQTLAELSGNAPVAMFNALAGRDAASVASFLKALSAAQRFALVDRNLITRAREGTEMGRRLLASLPDAERQSILQTLIISRLTGDSADRLTRLAAPLVAPMAPGGDREALWRLAWAANTLPEGAALQAIDVAALHAPLHQGFAQYPWMLAYLPVNAQTLIRASEGEGPSLFGKMSRETPDSR